MFALLKNGKLVKLTASAQEGADLLAKGEIDGMYKVENLDALAKLLKDSTPSGQQVRASLEKLWRQAVAATDDLADHLHKEYHRLEVDQYVRKVKAGGKTFLTEVKSAVKKAKAAAHEAGQDKK
jgi:hypothetical protein